MCNVQYSLQQACTASWSVLVAVRVLLSHSFIVCMTVVISGILRSTVVRFRLQFSLSMPSTAQFGFVVFSQFSPQSAELKCTLLMTADLFMSLYFVYINSTYCLWFSVNFCYQSYSKHCCHLCSDTVKPAILKPLILAFLLAELSNTLKIAWDFEYSRPIIFAKSPRLRNSWNKGHAKNTGFTVVNGDLTVVKGT